MKTKRRTFDVMSSYYNYLAEKITSSYLAAKAKNKKFLVLIGEKHSDQSNNLIEFMVFDIVKKLDIKNFYHEMPEVLKPEVIRDYCDDLTGPKAKRFRSYIKKNTRIKEATAEDILVAVDEYDMNYIAIDTANQDSSTANKVKDRNQAMSDNINKHAQDGVVIVGAGHLIGLDTSLEGTGIDKDIYEVLTLNLLEESHFSTVEYDQYPEAFNYYHSLDKIVPSMSRGIISSINDISLDFSEFSINRQSLVSYPDCRKNYPLKLFKEFIRYHDNYKSSTITCQNDKNIRQLQDRVTKIEEYINQSLNQAILFTRPSVFLYKAMTGITSWMSSAIANLMGSSNQETTIQQPATSDEQVIDEIATFSDGIITIEDDREHNIEFYNETQILTSQG